ncbi:unnamed protein product [Arctogadus glacialis]
MVAPSISASAVHWSTQADFSAAHKEPSHKHRRKLFKTRACFTGLLRANREANVLFKVQDRKLFLCSWMPSALQ